MRVINDLAMIVILSCLIGCMLKRPTRSEIVGSYNAKLENGITEVVELYENGTYKQEICFSNNEVVHSTGEWMLLNAVSREGNKRCVRISFTNMRESVCYGVPDNIKIGELKIGNVHDYPIEYSFWGRIRIIINPDLDIYLKK